jgi:acyl carrier protein
MSDSTRAQIRQVLAEHTALSPDLDGISDETDLFQAGMTSFSSVNVMLALEAIFDVEFPDVMLRRDVFSSIEAISEAVGVLTATAG